jgi:hypothetical protein
MTAMSTPLHQLPAGTPSPTTNIAEDDPMVNDVIHEMEKEFKAKHAPPAPQQHAPPQPMYHPAPHAMTTPVMKNKSPWLNETAAKRAAICAVAAFILFYPDDLSAFYSKNAFLAKLAPYDKLFRAAVLAVVLYVLFWKLEI